MFLDYRDKTLFTLEQIRAIQLGKKIVMQGPNTSHTFIVIHLRQGQSCNWVVRVHELVCYSKASLDKIVQYRERLVVVWIRAVLRGDGSKGGAAFGFQLTSAIWLSNKN